MNKKILNRIKELEENEYKGTVIDQHHRMKINDTDLKKLFTSIIDRWYGVDQFKDILGDTITINTTDLKRPPISNYYLKRLTKLTGEKWGQKRGYDNKGNYIVKFYTIKNISE